MYKTYDKTVKTRQLNYRFDPDFRRMHSFVYWFLLVFILFFNCIFHILTFSASKIVFFVIFCEFRFLPEFCELFSVFRITENWGLYLNCTGLFWASYNWRGGRRRLSMGSKLKWILNTSPRELNAHPSLNMNLHFIQLLFFTFKEGIYSRAAKFDFPFSVFLHLKISILAQKSVFS